MSTVAIIVGGEDVTDAVIFASASFEQSMNAEPGTFSITVRDPLRVLSFQTGAEILLEIDSVPMFGGYVTQVSMSSQAPAAATSDLDSYDLRVWILRGVDYNIIFDRRVIRNTDNYLRRISIPISTDGAMLTEVIEDYTDTSDFDTSGIDSSATVPGSGNDPLEQGTKLRQIFSQYSFWGGTIWYVRADKVFVYVPFEEVEKRWGFSDTPNGDPITVSPDEYQGATTGFRQVEGTEDGSFIENDVLVWGGSEFAGPGSTVFARVEDATSQSTYGRWQYAETHFGEPGYRIQAGVDARANVIVNGPPGADVYGQQKGLRYAQWQFTFTWNGSDVPELSGMRDHLVAGDIVTIVLASFGVTKLLPLRTLRISFPDALEDDGSHLVQFDGTFGLQPGDPFTLWTYLLNNIDRVSVQTVTTASDSTPTTTYGSYYQGIPTPAPDDTETVFLIPFPYVPGTLQVYLDTGAGLVLLRNGTDFSESDPEAGEFTMADPPAATDNLYAVALTQDAARPVTFELVVGGALNALVEPVYGVGDPGFGLDSDFMGNESQVSVSGNIATITAVYDAGLPAGRTFRSACIGTKDTWSQLYGTFEAEIEYPDGMGVWPAFWLLEEGSTSTPPELDILEAYPGANALGTPGVNFISASLHTSGPVQTIAYNTGSDNTDEWHHYKAVWAPGSIQIFFDGVLIRQFTTNVPNVPMYPIWNLALGATDYRTDGTTPTTLTMRIRNARAYQ